MVTLKRSTLLHPACGPYSQPCSCSEVGTLSSPLLHIEAWRLQSRLFSAPFGQRRGDTSGHMHDSYLHPKCNAPGHKAGLLQKSCRRILLGP